jgi:hypothetical protein
MNKQMIVGTKEDHTRSDTEGRRNAIEDYERRRSAN